MAAALSQAGPSCFGALNFPSMDSSSGYANQPRNDTQPRITSTSKTCDVPTESGPRFRRRTTSLASHVSVATEVALTPKASRRPLRSSQAVTFDSNPRLSENGDVDSDGPSHPPLTRVGQALSAYRMRRRLSAAAKRLAASNDHASNVLLGSDQKRRSSSSKGSSPYGNVPQAALSAPSLHAAIGKTGHSSSLSSSSPADCPAHGESSGKDFEIISPVEGVNAMPSWGAVITAADPTYARQAADTGKSKEAVEGREQLASSNKRRSEAEDLQDASLSAAGDELTPAVKSTRARKQSISVWFRARKWSTASQQHQPTASLSMSPVTSSSSSAASTRPSTSPSEIIQDAEDKASANIITQPVPLPEPEAAAEPPTSKTYDILNTPGKAFVLDVHRVRTARKYIADELSKLTGAAMGQDLVRIAQFIEKSRSIIEPEARECAEFWNDISNGVVLCLLANALQPGAIDRIDRRELEWVKADNLSRFLRAARDHFAVRSKDLFHPLDMADATEEGLDRAIHTILAVKKHLKKRSVPLEAEVPSSPGRPEQRRSNRQSVAVRPLDLSMMETQIGTADRASLQVPWTPQVDASFEDESETHPPARQELTIQEHRQAAQDRLSGRGHPSMTLIDEALLNARRRSAGSQTSSTSSNVSPMGDGLPILGRTSFSPATGSPAFTASSETGYSRSPYRDRKVNESATSLLLGVTEEETPDASVYQRSPVAPTTELPDTNLEGLAVPSSPFQKTFTNSKLQRSGSKMVRNDSQRRISMEIALANAAVRGSSVDGFALEGRLTPPKIPPNRRHSARAATGLINGLSHLNPHRRDSDDSIVGSVLHATQIPASRGEVGFSVGQYTPNRKQSPGGQIPQPRPRAGSTTVDGSMTQFPFPISPVLSPNRPAHPRHTSDLSAWQASRSQDVLLSSPMARPLGVRPRFDSGSPGLSHLNDVQSVGSAESEGMVRSASSRLLGQDSTLTLTGPVSRHKLVVVGQGGNSKDITYQMGNCIGRGQFGSVYRALNLNTGQMVAVKRIKTTGKTEKEVKELMHEVDLLQSLDHPSIVKYEGLVRGPNVLSIILEYVENGSLLHTLKAFGIFPEKLVAGYVVRILEGLDFLHERKVVHCDLKAANILTTKNGNVKLSDFGVSLNLKAMERNLTSKRQDAIGTPNWMAPEVIELHGASTASDIWSLGCTIIELLTGKPPYGDLLAMSAMFRIVEDDRPPIPEKCSPPLADFLLKCFQKDPTLRPSAAELFDHEWLSASWTGALGGRASGGGGLKPQDSMPFLKRISTDSRFRLEIKALAQGDGTALADKATSADPATGSGDETAVADKTIDLASHRRSLPAELPQVIVPGGAAVLLGDITMNDSIIARAAIAPLSADLGSPPRLSVEFVQLPADVTAQREATTTPRSHLFIKSTFSKSVHCRLCSGFVRKHAVLCDNCGLISHASCAQDDRAGRCQPTQQTGESAARPSLEADASPVELLRSPIEGPSTSTREHAMHFFRWSKIGGNHTKRPKASLSKTTTPDVEMAPLSPALEQRLEGDIPELVRRSMEGDRRAGSEVRSAGSTGSSISSLASSTKSRIKKGKGSQLSEEHKTTSELGGSARGTSERHLADGLPIEATPQPLLSTLASMTSGSPQAPPYRPNLSRVATPPPVPSSKMGHRPTQSLSTILQSRANSVIMDQRPIPPFAVTEPVKGEQSTPQAEASTAALTAAAQGTSDNAATASVKATPIVKKRPSTFFRLPGVTDSPSPAKAPKTTATHDGGGGHDSGSGVFSQLQRHRILSLRSSNKEAAEMKKISAALDAASASGGAASFPSGGGEQTGSDAPADVISRRKRMSLLTRGSGGKKKDGSGGGA